MVFQRGLERTTFWIPSSATDGTGQITVTVNGETSNALSFTVSLAKIYFISVSDGNNTYNGLYSTFQSGSNGPFRDIKMFNPGLNPSRDTESYIVYVKGGTYTALDVDGTFVALRGPYGSADRRHALIGYPGETPTLDLTNATRTAIWNANYSPYGRNNYFTYSKLRFKGGAGVGTAAIDLWGDYIRIIGNQIEDLLANAWTGTVMVDNSQYSKIYGNYFRNNGYDSYKHNIYIKTHADYIAGDKSAEYTYIGWNEFTDAYASDTHGGVIFVSKASDASSKFTRYIWIHDNYFHDGNMEFIYTGDNTPLSDIYIYNNIFQGGTCTNAGIFLAWDTTSVYLYNNIFYQIGAAGTNMIGVAGRNGTNSFFKNNIFYSRPGQTFVVMDASGPTNFTSDYDLYYDPDGTTTLPSGSGITVTNARTGDPLFVNPSAGDFTLQSSSPAIDAGTSSVSAIVSVDYNGNPRPMGTGYDIGAYEYNGPAVPMLQFSSGTYSVSEGAATATINVTRIGSATGAVSVNYATSNGTATAGSDYTATSGTLNWTDGEAASKTFTVSITNDTAIESDETINLTVSNPTGGAILGSQNTATLTILDDDGPSTLRFENSSYSVNEGTATATIRVLRTGSSVGAVSVNYATSNGTAIAASDYTAASNTLIWIEGDTAAKSFTIAITNDTTVESSETVNITLSNPTNGAVLGGTNPVALTITDNDSSTTTTTLGKDAGSNEISGGGCGFVKDSNGKGPGQKAEGRHLQ